MDGNLCGRGCSHGGSGRSSSSLVANKSNFKNRCTRSLEQGSKIITGRICTKVARSRIFILFFLTLLNLFLQNTYYTNEEGKSFSKLELSIGGCSRKLALAEIRQLRESATLARLALKKEDSDHLRKYKEDFYKRMEERLKQVGPDPLPSCLKKGDKITTVKKKMQFVEPEEIIQKGKTSNRTMLKVKFEEQNEMEKNEMEKNEMGKNEKGKNEMGKNEKGKNEMGKNEMGKNGKGKNEMGKNEMGKNGKGKKGKEKDEKEKEEAPVDPMKHLRNEKNKIMTTAELKKKYDDILYKHISKEEMKEIMDSIEASDYDNIRRSKNVVYNEDDNDQLPYDCTMREISEKITEDFLSEMTAELRKVVSPKDMFIIWHYVQAFGRDKYLRMNGDLWRLCGHVQKEYNIPDDIKKREWQEIAGYMSSELLDKEHKDYLDFKELANKGSCKKSKFYEFIDSKRSSWKFLTAIMMDSWKEALIERLKSYSIEEE
ncbi:Plasmodium exported protein (PHIST), unknown function [Plasmodium vivax]|uniref:Plasmodium RESA N-terminal domain-containing protein n=1 Tax=Plasmodium vivax TaxID=5855 RepID=A0A1G4H8G7_PLAVI|nr:Plasmodium exported protein (PHIST), unknown function [Plasmodium vivax]